MTRILTAAALIPLVVWAVLGAPAWVFLLLAMLVGVGAHREFDALAAAHGILPAGWLGVACGLAVLFAPEPALPIVVVLGAVLMAAKLASPELSQALPGAATALLGVIYIFGAWRCAVLLRELNPHWLMVALLVSWAGDTAALYAGKAWGRARLAPRVSPGKTRVGAVASTLGGVVAAGIYGHFLLPAPWPKVMLISALANLAGQLGDLCESAFKRGARVKDSGTTLPGHGGWLDRVDSSLFSIPAVYVALRLWPA
jgi:phosphatidate cytidylyltransferase